MEEKKSLYCVHSIFIDMNDTKDTKEITNMSNCEIHGLDSDDRVRDCKDYVEDKAQDK